MFALIAKLRIDPADGAKLEAAFAEAAQGVREKEPDTLVYHLTRIRGTEGEYRVLELYRSEEAFKVHLASDHFQAFRPKMAALVVAPPEAERLDVVI